MVNANPIATPDIARLVTMFAQQVRVHGFQAPGRDSCDQFIAQPGDAVLFFAEDPRRVPETWDVAVILPELLAGWRGALRVGLLDPTVARQLAPGYAIRVWPTLIFMRDGKELGRIERMCDWDDFVTRTAALLGPPVRLH